MFRRNIIRHRFAFIVLCLALLAWSCVNSPSDPVAKGGGSDTETLTGILSTSTGVAAARTLVKIMPSNYDPRHPDSTLMRKVMTDDSGKFTVAKLDSNLYYNVIAGKASEHAWAY